MRVTVLCSVLLVVGVASPQVTMYGVLMTENHEVTIDSVDISGDTFRMLVRTSGWSGQPQQYDTFEFAPLPGWPTLLKVYVGFYDSVLITSIESLVGDSWYSLNGPYRPPEPKVMFHQLSAVAEPELRSDRTATLGVTPTVGGRAFRFSAAGAGILEVRNAAGRLVRRMPLRANGIARWAGEDDDGHLLPEGLYHCVARTRGDALFGKAVLVR